MILYAKKPITASALRRGLITLDAEGRDALLETIFQDDPSNRHVQLWIQGQAYPARLLNNARQGMSHSVQLLCTTTGTEALRRAFSHTWGAWRQAGDQDALSSEEQMAIRETESPLAYEVVCYTADAQPPVDETPPTEIEALAFPEGKVRYALHARRERSPIVTRLAKSRFTALHGRVFCEVCGFSFAERYGEIGEDFIEAHHMVPVSELSDDGQTRVEDLCLVCSNCHRMLHRKRPWLRPDQLRSLLRGTER